MSIHRLLAIVSILLLPFSSLAETVYIIDKIEVGLHTNAKLNSPIQKLVVTGTPLEIQQRGVDMSKVKTLDGTVGWVNTAYLVDQAPGGANSNQQKIQELQSALSRSETEIKQLKSDLSNINTIQESKELKSMKLKVAELEAQLSKEKKSTIPTSSTESTAELDTIKQKNVALEQTIAQLKQQVSGNSPAIQTQFTQSSTVLWIILGAIIIGIILGILLLDLYRRHQHGGFRI